MSARQCPRCHCVNDSMTEVAGDLHRLACGYVADVPMEAWDECEAQKDARIAELEALLEASNGAISTLETIAEQRLARIAELEAEKSQLQATLQIEVAAKVEARQNWRQAERSAL